MADLSKVRSSQEDKKPPAKTSLALPTTNDKRVSGGGTPKDPRRLSDANRLEAKMSDSSDRSSDHSPSSNTLDPFALATTSSKLPPSASSDSLRELSQPRRRSVEIINPGRIGPYEYEKAVQGLMGKFTYFGYRTDTNAKVTIKIIEKKHPSVDALRVEYTLLRNISHPNILQVYDILEDDQNVYFVMEFASRGRLIYEIGSNGPLQERELKIMMQQIVSAVLHNYELRHAVFREMELDYFTYFRAENVFVDQEGSIKLGAYGTLDLRKPSRTWFKQFSFAAPEILKGKTFLLGMDAWSLGVLMYVLAKANFPFSGETVDDVLKSTATPPKLDVGSEEMRNLCNSLLQANIFGRLPMVEIPKHSWWTSSASSGSELTRQQSRKDTDERGKKGKSIFGISFGKDTKDKKSASSESKP